MQTAQDTTILKTVPAAAFVRIEIGTGRKQGINRWVNLANIKTITVMDNIPEIHLYPNSGAMITVKDPASIQEVLNAIASYSVTPL